jgi:hypothetical protein
LEKFRKIFGPMWDEVGNLMYYIMRSFVTYIGHPLLLG